MVRGKQIMIKQSSRIFLIISSLIFLSGCATPEKNIALTENFWKDSKHKITVANTKITNTNKPKLHSMGNQGLLDMAISSAATKTFSNYLEKTDCAWYNDLSKKFVGQLKKRNISSEIHPMYIDPEQKKEAVFTAKIDGNKLLLIELQQLGAIRNYYGFIPTGAPKAYCLLKGELINREDKQVLWRHITKIEEPVQGNWDQPPAYPNFTLALQQAVVSAQEEMIDSFFSGH
jgi:ABC-type uncharacterized transport system auxiliary subunit